MVTPDKLFKNYVYLSGTSQTLQTFFKLFAVSTIMNNFKYRNEELREIKVLDIACNDGSQLDAFSALNVDENIKIITVGVDPAENIYKEISSKKVKHDIYCEFFSQNTVDKLKAKYGSFDIIIAQNVFAHIDYPKEFLEFAKQIMTDQSTMFIQTSQKNMILENQFDTVYHEHLSFFTTNSMNYLCKRADLVLNNVYDHFIHGTSYIFEITKCRTQDANTGDIIRQEIDEGLYSLETYSNYKLNCLKYRNDFTNKIINYKLNNKKIIAFGSTAKSMTVFNFCRLNSTFIDLMIDENKLKQNLYTPGSNILVCPIDILKHMSENTVILITAWNFYKEIVSKLRERFKEYNITFPVTVLNINTLEEETI